MKSPVREVQCHQPNGTSSQHHAPSPVRFLQNGGAYHQQYMTSGVPKQHPQPQMPYKHTCTTSAPGPIMNQHQQQPQSYPHGYPQKPQYPPNKWQAAQHGGQRERVLSPVRHQQQAMAGYHGQDARYAMPMGHQLPQRRSTPPILISNGAGRQQGPPQVNPKPASTASSHHVIMVPAVPANTSKGKYQYVGQQQPPQQSHYVNMSSASGAGTGYPDQYVQAGVRPAAIGAELGQQAGSKPVDENELPPEGPPPPPPPHAQDFEAHKPGLLVPAMKERSYSDSGLDKIAGDDDELSANKRANRSLCWCQL